ETVAKHLLAPGFTYFRLETHASPDLAALPEFATPGLLGWLRAIPVLALAIWRDFFSSARSAVRPDLPGTPRVPPRDRAVKPYAGKPVVIVDAGCFSTTDNLVACLADQHPHIRFVGRPTGGGTGAPRTLVTLRHSGIEVTFCVMRVYRPRGELIEGRGTKPHVTVSWSRRDVLERKDPDLAAALLEARSDSTA
ncbi:MAG TPA: S41 family peptidase, partial [Planctomycetota bacterium]|nr:S41 family peptidase [Planctomycetota bacterium]